MVVVDSRCSSRACLDPWQTIHRLSSRCAAPHEVMGVTTVSVSGKLDSMHCLFRWERTCAHTETIVPQGWNLTGAHRALEQQ